jgi:hypothetical protein
MAPPADARLEAAVILRRIIEALKPPASIAGYLRGYTDGLEGKRRPRATRR